MKVDRKLDLAYAILTALKYYGYEGYIVGGAVRDMSLGMVPNDYDIATNATPEQIAELFEGAVQTGSNFPVMRWRDFEIATYRKDLGVDGWEFAKTIDEDLARRDLTINAVAINFDTKERIGTEYSFHDIEGRFIRFVGDPESRILEDPLRILRALRFSAMPNFSFEEKSWYAIMENAELVLECAPERIWEELMKVMSMPHKDIAKYFDMAYHSGVLTHILPEMAANYGVAGGLYHNETVWNHLLYTGAGIPQNNKLLRFAAYMHDIGKAPAWNGQNFRHHASTGMVLMRQICARYKVSNKDTEYLSGLVSMHMRNIYEEVTDKTYRKLLRDLEEAGIPKEDWLALRVADHNGNKKNVNDPYREEWKEMFLSRCERLLEEQPAEFSINDLKIGGKDLIEMGYEPSPKFGEVLRHLFAIVLDNPETNTYSFLKREAKRYLKEHA